MGARRQWRAYKERLGLCFYFLVFSHHINGGYEGQESADQRNNQGRWQSEVNNLKEMCHI